uniref:Uncharacterized protein n=1 Tax=Sparus aurata TaxID=8175 RepID=A0A671TLG6_SPAAU
MKQQQRGALPHCCVPLCQASREIRWIVAIRRDKFTITPASETARRLLKRGSVPELFEWNSFSLPLPRQGAWERRQRLPEVT